MVLGGSLHWIFHLPPIKRTIEQYGMIVHPMGRKTTTLSGRLSICKLDNKQIRKPNLTITITLSNGVFHTKTGVFTKTVNKLTNRDIRFLFCLFVNLRFKSKSTEKALLGLQMQTLHDMIRT